MQSARMCQAGQKKEEHAAILAASLSSLAELEIICEFCHKIMSHL